MIEDWDFSTEDLREFSNEDSLDFHYRDFYEFDSDLLSSNEDYTPFTHRASTPWKAQHRKIPPLYIPKKGKCSGLH